MHKLQWHGPGPYIICVGDPAKAPVYRKRFFANYYEDLVDEVEDALQAWADDGSTAWGYYLGGTK